MTSPGTPTTESVIAGIYADAELRLIALIAESLDRGITAPDWAIRQLGEVGRLSAAAQGLLNQLHPIVAATIQQALNASVAAGVAAANTQIASATAAGFTMSAPAAAAATVIETAAVTALAAETVRAVTATHGAILRSTQDAYRQIIAETTGRTVTGVQNRRQVLQQALDRFAKHGLSGFTDKSGRRWRMDTYADMALRTSAFRAQTQGHTNRLKQRGYDLVVVSHHPRPAPQCRPFEGKVLSIDGTTPNGTHTVDGVRGKTRVRVVASLEQAKADGFQHPNCRHRYTLYVPGARIPEPEPYDEQGYHDEQKLRYLERQVRDAKRRVAAAIDDDARTQANARVRALQGRIRDHVATTGVPRRRHREQLREGTAANAITPGT